VGPGDVLKNADLFFGGGAEIQVDGRLLSCEIKLAGDATLVITETGSLEGCRVSGGRVHVRGRFIAPASIGLYRPTELRVFETGRLATELEQHQGQTRFGFTPGCRLRLYIKTTAMEGQGADDAD
jgi:hypothetical protein